MEKEKKYLLLNWILLIGYASLTVFTLYSSAYLWPTQGSIIWLLLLLFCPPFLYQLAFIVYVLRVHKKPHWRKLYRFISIIGGVLLAGGLLQITQKISFSRFKTAYAPMLNKIAQNMPQPCNGQYFSLPTVAAYNVSVSQKIISQQRPAGQLFYNQKRFVVYFRGGSVDMNNSSIFYDSELKNWYFFHNSRQAAVQSFTVRISGLTACKNF